eukprot:CAMPEP_0117491706 /NCGR_PEP_ID=MMETSP0784-20121206/18206_1 /TAXON_ID=39447 /ORGANISM="" /LENGTH=138 /DNA_ID=CAMNT_0005286507 /DNA_START=89 /DNA_END=506 /DNA_ORIENTATION=-
MVCRPALLALCTLASAQTIAAEARQGLCPGTNYQNIGWGGMSRSGCIERAAEVERDSGSFVLVRLVQRELDTTKPREFLPLLPELEDPLEQPTGEVWETNKPSEAKDANGSDGLKIALVVVLAVLLVADANAPGNQIV